MKPIYEIPKCKNCVFLGTFDFSNYDNIRDHLRIVSDFYYCVNHFPYGNDWLYPDIEPGDKLLTRRSSSSHHYVNLIYLFDIIGEMYRHDINFIYSKVLLDSAKRKLISKDIGDVASLIAKKYK